MTNTEIAQGIRQLADLLERNPDMAQPYSGTESTILFFAHDKRTFAATVTAFGRGAKCHDDDSLIFAPDFPLPVKVIGFKSGCCEARPIMRIVPERVVPAQEAKPETVIPAHEETIIEYSCTPFLATEGTRTGRPRHHRGAQRIEVQF